MAVVAEQVGAAPLVGGGQTALHSHAGGAADVKSALVSNMAYGTQAVSFGVAFAATPRVVVSFASQKTRTDWLNAESITATGLTIRYTKGSGGASENADIAWIATDAGG